MAAEAPTFVQNKYQLFGLTDQQAPPTLMAVTMYQRGASTVLNSGTAALNIQAMDIDQFKSRELTLDGDGVPSQLTIFAEGIRMKLTVVPEGTTLDDTAATGVLAAASVPAEGAYVKITHAPVMAFGCFAKTDHNGGGALNTCNWLVEDAGLRPKAGGRWEVELTVACYKSTKMKNPYVND